MTDDCIGVDKLTIEHYSGLLWKFQMRLYLISKGLFSIVHKSEKAAYLERAQQAFTIIRLSVSSSLVYLISDSSTASKAWEKLQTHFERDTVANKFFLKKRYFRTTGPSGYHARKLTIT